MIRILIYLAIILVGLCISPYLVGSTGYVYIAAGDYQIETSLVFSVIALIVLFSLLWLVEWLLVFSINIIRNSRYLPGRWRKKTAQKNTLLGALSLAEEDWVTAEKTMLKGASSGEIPALNLLAAARAAQHQQKNEARDKYLAEAAKDPVAATAVATTRTRYLLQQNKIDEARKALDELAPTSKSKSSVLRLASEIYQAQQDWQALKLLLPVISKRQLLSSDKLQSLTEHVNASLLIGAGKTSLAELEKCWQWLSRSERAQPQYLAIYIQALADNDKQPQAIKLLMKKIKSEPDPALWKVLPNILSDDDNDVIDKLVQAADKYQNSCDYHVCMARVYQSQHAFQQAKLYWQKVCEQDCTREYLVALADVQDQLGEHFGAIDSYRKAAHC